MRNRINLPSLQTFYIQTRVTFLINICSDALTGASPWRIKEETQSTDTRTIARIKFKESNKLSLPHQKDDQTKIKTVTIYFTKQQPLDLKQLHITYFKPT